LVERSKTEERKRKKDKRLLPLKYSRKHQEQHAESEIKLKILLNTSSIKTLRGKPSTKEWYHNKVFYYASSGLFSFVLCLSSLVIIGTKFSTPP
jgi:hypothetical protein